MNAQAAVKQPSRLHSRAARSGRLALAVVTASIALGAIAIGALGTSAGASSDNMCLTVKNKIDRDCPSIDATATISVKGDAIRVAIGSAAEWAGGPIAVEMSVPDAAVKDADGAPKKQTMGYANWTSRNGTVISRCQFSPASRPIKAGGVAECDLGLLGLKDGPHTMWMTGFVGAVPKPGADFGTVPAGHGVVPVATPRSIEFTLKAGAVSLDKPSTTDTKNPPAQVTVTKPDSNPVATTAKTLTTTAATNDKSGGFPWPAAGGAAALAVLVAGFVAKKRMSGTPSTPTTG